MWPSKMRAKQHVALLMCEQLHKMQQLDDHLCPIVDVSLLYSTYLVSECLVSIYTSGGVI